MHFRGATHVVQCNGHVTVPEGGNPLSWDLGPLAYCGPNVFIMQFSSSPLGTMWFYADKSLNDFRIMNVNSSHGNPGETRGLTRVHFDRWMNVIPNPNATCPPLMVNKQLRHVSPSIDSPVKLQLSKRKNWCQDVGWWSYTWMNFRQRFTWIFVTYLLTIWQRLLSLAFLQSVVDIPHQSRFVLRQQTT